MHTITATDLPVLRELGVRTAIDFRSNLELDQIGIGPLGKVSITHLHCPTFDMNPNGEAPFVGGSAATFYARMMKSARRRTSPPPTPSPTRPSSMPELLRASSLTSTSCGPA